MNLTKSTADTALLKNAEKWEVEERNNFHLYINVSESLQLFGRGLVAAVAPKL